MTRIERRRAEESTTQVSTTPVSLEQLLSDLGGLERLQALQMSLVQQLRRQVESVVRPRRSSPRRSPLRRAR